MSANRHLGDFVALVQDIGIARNNRYETFIKFPSFIGVGMDMEPLLRLFCARVSIPTLSYMTWEHNTYGEARTVPYQKKYDPISFTFYMDQKFDIKKIFDKWMSYSFDMNTRISNYYDDYAKNCEITLDVYNVDEMAPAYTVVFYEVYPKAVQEISLGADRRDIMTLNVVFQYKYYKVSGVDSV